MERHNVFRSDRIRETEALLRAVKARRVLEIGAGDYSFRGLAHEDAPTWTTADWAAPCDVVCDLNSEALVLPFDHESYDLVLCTEVLEHLLWPQRLLAEAHRVLAQNGRILVSVPNAASLSYRISWLMGRIPSCAASGNLPIELGSTAYRQADGRLSGGHVIDFNLPRISRLLEVQGFIVEAVRGSGIIWHRQVIPSWLLPASLSSNIILLGRKA